MESILWFIRVPLLESGGVVMRRCGCFRSSSVTYRIKALSCHHHRKFNGPNVLVAADWFNETVAKNPEWFLYFGASSWRLCCRQSGCWWQISSRAQNHDFWIQKVTNQHSCSESLYCRSI
eukprot:scaffold1087_cov136-Cylindrotheca_fusiformis.AAC.3